MVYIYELGYGSYEESEYAQLQHRRKFSQYRFEKMVLDCTLQAARMEYDVQKKKWSEDLDVCHKFEKDSDDEYFEFSELISGRKLALENAMSWRLDGNERMYLNSLKDAYFMKSPSLTYQSLHKLVVWLMCEMYGFKSIEKLRVAHFFGWSDLSIQNNWGNVVAKGSLTARAGRLVRKFVLKSFGRSGADVKWGASRERALRKNPAGGDNEDRILCEELGVEFIPYNHKIAVQARKTVNINGTDNLF